VRFDPTRIGIYIQPTSSEARKRQVRQTRRIHVFRPITIGESPPKRILRFSNGFYKRQETSSHLNAPPL